MTDIDNLDKLSQEEATELIESLENPEHFIEVFLERELSPKQKLFVRQTKTHKHILAIWSRQTGKSTVIASFILYKLLYGKGVTINKEWMPEHIAIVAPIKDQIRNLYEKIKTLVDRSEFISSFITKMNTEMIIAKNGNEAKFLSASPGSQIRGYTATVIVIDESQDITDSKYSGDILPFGATTNALVIEAGTPKTKNHFYKGIHNKNILTIKQPWFECPFLSEEYVMGQKAISPEPLWRQEYLCEFMEEGVLAFPSVLFEPEMKNGILSGRWNLGEYNYISKISQFTREKANEVNELIREGATYTAGLDLGKHNDNTIYTIVRTDIRPMKIAVQINFPLKTPYTQIAQQISMFHKVYGPTEFNLDYTNEKSFIEMLQDNDVNVIQNKDNKRGAISFTVQNKAEMVSTGRVLLENYSLQLPKKAEILISQFLNQQFEIVGKNYKYFHPSNEHDDMLWSTLLAIKNIPILSENDFLTFRNPWEKFDEEVHGATVDTTKEILATNQSRKRFGRDSSYKPADLRRSRRF